MDWHTTSLTLPIRSLLLVTHTNGVTLYAGAIQDGADPGGVYRSSDGGLTWQSLGLTDVSVTDMVVDPENPLHLYVGVHTYNKTPGVDSYLYQSYDGGDTWTIINLEGHQSGCGDVVAQIEIDPRSPANIYMVMANNGNICHSADQGQTWEEIYIMVQEWGKGSACAIDIYRLPEQGGTSLDTGSIQAQATATQSLIYMGATSGVYRGILVDERRIYLPIILKAAF